MKKDTNGAMVEMNINNSGKIEAFTLGEKKKLLIEHYNLLEPFLLLEGVPNDTWLRDDNAFYKTERKAQPIASGVGG